ncbi:MAG TPA: LysR substrate-binding domain-containing protein, partial [Methylibium sp.]|nr:LysR substrate-binding domain-containing protein [Methylibium sp.]
GSTTHSIVTLAVLTICANLPVSSWIWRAIACIGIRQGEEAYGTWRLISGRGRSERVEAVKTRGPLATNDGEIAVNWALDGHGIVMRAEWDVERYLKSGRLVPVLPQYRTPDADIYAVYPQRHQLSARVRAFVDFVALSFPPQAGLART